MRTAYDSITAADVPWAPVVMGYDDGNWPDAPALAERYPASTVVRITTDPADNFGDMLDVESGDAQPADAPPWTRRRRQAGHLGPLTYFPNTLRGVVVMEYGRQGVQLPGLFAAAMPGPGPVLINPATDVGHQYANNAAGNYDTSVVVDYLPGIDPPPPAVTVTSSPRGALMLHTIGFTTDSQGCGAVVCDGGKNTVLGVTSVSTLIPWSTFEAVSMNGPDPAADGGYWPGNVKVQNRRGNVLVSVQGFIPRALAVVFVLASV